MKHIYIVSEEGNNAKHKLGVHSGTQHDLLHRYQTYLVNPTIKFYKPTKHAREYEKLCHAALRVTGRSCYRTNTKKVKESEWYNMDVHEMLDIVNPILAKRISQQSLVTKTDKPPVEKPSNKPLVEKTSAKKAVYKKATVKDVKLSATKKTPRMTIRATAANYDPNDYNTWKKTELIELCVDLGLAKSGTKPDLVDRILKKEESMEKKKKRIDSEKSKIEAERSKIEKRKALEKFRAEQF